MTRSSYLHLLSSGALILWTACGCHAQVSHEEHPTGAAAANGPAAFIGVATQEPDGTIVMQLRVDQGGLVGDGLVRYKRGDPNYEVVSKHVGPIPHGGSVAVKPFPAQ